MIIGPVNWYSCSTSIKAMFDRLVCSNLTITADEAEELLDGDIKNSELTRKIEKSGKHANMLKNHLEGKVAAVFAHGDYGAADYKDIAKGKWNQVAQESPETAKEVDGSHKSFEEPHMNPAMASYAAYAPIVLQCRYSGIEVPEHLFKGVTINRGVPYSVADDSLDETGAKEAAIKVAKDLIQHIQRKR